MIMANFQKSSVCLVCSSNTNKITNNSDFNSEVCSNFLRFVSRYLSYGHRSFNNNKIHQFLTTVKSPRFSCINNCCDICVEQLKRFLEVYEGFELIQLELFNILDCISTTMLRAGLENKIRKEFSDLQVTFANLVEQKRTQRLPLVQIKRLETRNIKVESSDLFEGDTVSPLSVNYIKLEPSHFEDDQPNFQDFNLDPNFETGSQNNSTDTLDWSENEEKPFILSIDNDDNSPDQGHAQEEKISNSNHLFQSHQKLKRKLPQNLKNPRVKCKSNLICPFCSKKKQDRHALFVHLRQHTEERMYHCKQCLAEYRYQTDFRTHIIKGHDIDDVTGEKRPACIKDKPCPICGKFFPSNSSVRSHVSYIHTKIKRFKCEHENCSKAFVKRCDLIKHLKVHSDLKPFECNICYKMFKRSSDVYKHKLLIHGDENGEKRICAKCSVCGKYFPGIWPLRLHRARNHPEIFKEDRESLMKFKCPRAPCDKKFYSRYQMKIHIRRNHKS